MHYSSEAIAKASDGCDLVMKGGVTSGVVYPRAIVAPAHKYRFKSIGGASAGALRRRQSLVNCIAAIANIERLTALDFVTACSAKSSAHWNLRTARRTGRRSKLAGSKHRLAWRRPRLHCAAFARSFARGQ